MPYANVAYLRAHIAGAEAVDVETHHGQNHFIVWNEETRVSAALAAMLAAVLTICR